MSDVRRIINFNRFNSLTAAVPDAVIKLSSRSHVIDKTAASFLVLSSLKKNVMSTRHLLFCSGFQRECLVVFVDIYIYIESLMSCHLLLNLLHELANMILCEALPSILSFLPTNVINLVINDNEFEILFIT